LKIPEVDADRVDRNAVLVDKPGEVILACWAISAPLVVTAD
jgi:hypothetical protein